MLRVGLIGWRGMVGSVLLQRMSEEKDFAGIDPVFFSTSNAGGTAPPVAPSSSKLLDAKDLKALAACDVLMSCQGGDYTTEVFAPLRKSGWKGFWIDAASTLRMSDDAIKFSSRELFVKFLDQRVGGLAGNRRSHTNANPIAGIGLEYKPRFGTDRCNSACRASVCVIDGAGDFTTHGNQARVADSGDRFHFAESCDTERGDARADALGDEGVADPDGNIGLHHGM